MKNDYMSRENTTSVNGLFILLVFLNHIQSYVTLPEGFHRLTLAFGQLMVATFLFYSGYICFFYSDFRLSTGLAFATIQVR